MGNSTGQLRNSSAQGAEGRRRRLRARRNNHTQAASLKDYLHRRNFVCVEDFVASHVATRIAHRCEKNDVLNDSEAAAIRHLGQHLDKYELNEPGTIPSQVLKAVDKLIELSTHFPSSQLEDVLVLLALLAAHPAGLQHFHDRLHANNYDIALVAVQRAFSERAAAEKGSLATRLFELYTNLTSTPSSETISLLAPSLLPLVARAVPLVRNAGVEARSACALWLSNLCLLLNLNESSCAKAHLASLLRELMLSLQQEADPELQAEFLSAVALLLQGHPPAREEFLRMGGGPMIELLLGVEENCVGMISHSIRRLLECA